MEQLPYAAIAAKRAYVHAITLGVEPYVAFDVACASYRVQFPDMREDKLRSAVAKLLVDQIPADIDLVL